MKLARYLLAYLAFSVAIFMTLRCAHVPSQDDAYSRAYDSVTQIKGVQGFGTAFAVEHKGKKYLVTNAHVCAQADGGTMTVPVTASSGVIQDFKVKVVKISDKTDLCVLTGVDFLMPLTLGGEPYRNERLFMSGFPAMPFLSVNEGRMAGIAIEDFIVKKTKEECVGEKLRWVSEFAVQGSNLILNEGCARKSDLYYTTITGDFGCSGSPVFNQDFEVVGVAVMIRSVAAYVTAIPVATLQEFLAEIK